MKPFKFQDLGNYKLLNIAGLSIGIACVLGIMLWVEDELKFDSFNKNSDRIYRVLAEEDGMEGYTNSAMTMPPLAEALKDKLPEVEKATNFEADWQVVVKAGDNYLNEEGMAVVGKSFFDLFSFPFVKGNPGLLDSEKYAVVLSERTARKYFGEEDALGKQLEINKIPVKVVAIFKDINYNSHIRFDMAIPEELGISMFGRKKGSWNNQCLYTYVQVMPNVSSQLIASKIYNFIEKNINPERKVKLFPQALKDIHFHKGLADEDYTQLGDKRYVYIFSFMGLFILILACVNFINLSTAVSEKDIKANSIRKILGASKRKLLGKSVLKSVQISVVATGIALGFLFLVLPFLNALTRKSLAFDFLNTLHLFVLISVALFSGILSGLYPAFYLTSFSPIGANKIKKTHTGQWQRKGLVVFQFSLSIILIIATLVSFKQFNHFRQINLGFDKEHTVYFPLKTDNSGYQILKERLMKIPGIEMVAGKDYYSPSIINTTAVRLPGKEMDNMFSENRIDENFFSLLKVNFTDGQNFSVDNRSEWEQTVIINEKAKELMAVDNPVGMALKFWNRQFKIIGVIGETHFQSLNKSLQPELYTYVSDPHYIFVKYGNNPTISVNYLIGQIGTTVKEIYPEAPVNIQFLDLTYANLYENDKRVGTIFCIVAVIAILISCLGLFGLSSYSSEKRTKEIGIRKVNGAKVSEVLTMLNKDFVKWVGAAFIIATPIAWYAMQKWLESFAYKTSLSWWIFALAGLLALGIALLTVSWQSWRAATRNPVEALRYE